MEWTHKRTRTVTDIRVDQGRTANESSSTEGEGGVVVGAWTLLMAPPMAAVESGGGSHGPRLVTKD